MAVSETVTLQLDKTQLSNGGTINVTGRGPAGKPIFLEISAAKKVRTDLFDNKRDNDTG